VKNYQEFTWSSTKELEDSLIQGILVCCLFLSKLVIRLSPFKVGIEFLIFLKRIQDDIYGLIHPPSRLLRYFMVLVDVSTIWSHVCLLSTRNLTFTRLLAQIIRLQA